MGKMCYINHSGKYIEIKFDMKVPGFFVFFFQN